MKSYVRTAIGLVSMVIVGILPHQAMAKSTLCAAGIMQPKDTLRSARGTYTLLFNPAPEERLILYKTADGPNNFIWRSGVYPGALSLILEGNGTITFRANAFGTGKIIVGVLPTNQTYIGTAQAYYTDGVETTKYPDGTEEQTGECNPYLEVTESAVMRVYFAPRLWEVPSH